MTEFNINDTGQQLYRQWRDAYVAYDPEKAKLLLDEIGVKDTNGDGVRELPNGKKLQLCVEYAADMSEEHVSKDNQLVADLKAVGLSMTRTPSRRRATATAGRPAP
ncbi:ABC-type transport system substrate-binding protein [Microlunatus parietis]|uniref:ABC-type transport system substrate-binding protein n=1 Tax=Microlunatus parietis TaxID=682979 RepID=A0A7Y9I3U1_9ACTN|nr:ABC-type transport system substrate-binding protein [Microlunatus parietis]